MDYFKDLHELCETLSGELADINEKIRTAGGKMSAGDLEVVDKLTHSIKSIKAVMAMMEEEDGYSGYYPWPYAYADGQGGGGGSNRGGSYRGGGSYAEGGSNRGRGGSYARGGRSRRGYSGERGYSRNDLVDRMREMMDEAPDERTRQEMMRMIDKMENS